MRMLIIKILLLLLGSLILGVFIPGIIHYKNKSFSKEDVFNRLNAKNQNKIIVEERQSKIIAGRKSELLKILNDTTKELTPSQILELNKAMEGLGRIEKLVDDKSISLSTFYPKNNLLLLWPFLYFGLSALFFLVKTKDKYKLYRKHFWSIFILLILFMRWPTWIRNTFIGNINRIVYSPSNYDISKLGFFLQETQAIFSTLLLTLIFCKWISYSENLKSSLISNTQFSEMYFLKIIKKVRAIYQEWQLCSFLLAIAFGYYTYYFWSTIRETADFRYLPHAIIIHIIWGLSWIVLSFPLITIKNYHLNYKANYLRQHLSSNNSGKVDNDTQNFILKADPISTQNKTLTAIFSGIAFLLPLLNAFI